jgi:hypothetical protein
LKNTHLFRQRAINHHPLSLALRANADIHKIDDYGKGADAAAAAAAAERWKNQMADNMAKTGRQLGGIHQTLSEVRCHSVSLAEFQIALLRVAAKRCQINSCSAIIVTGSIILLPLNKAEDDTGNKTPLGIILNTSHPSVARNNKTSTKRPPKNISRGKYSSLSNLVCKIPRPTATKNRPRVCKVSEAGQKKGRKGRKRRPSRSTAVKPRNIE